MNLESQIEAILFFRGEPVKIKKLCDFLEKKEEEILPALTSLEGNLISRGIRLLRKDDEVMLSTAPEVSELIAKITKFEFCEDR